MSIVSNQPRDLWCDPWLNTGYDLVLWSANLAKYFPEINQSTSSYQRAYYLWRISSAVADKYSDYVIDYDNQLLKKPYETITALFSACGFDASNIDHLVSQIESEPTRNWRNYTNECAFEDIENRCEEILASTGILEYIDQGGLEHSGWPHSNSSSNIDELVTHLCSEVSLHRKLVPQYGLIYANLADERHARETERSGAVKQIQALTEWATSADAYAKSKVEEVGQLQADLAAYSNHWVFRLLRHPKKDRKD